jgi:hypothetical protein
MSNFASAVHLPKMRWFAALVLLALVQACATSPYDPAVKAGSDALLDQQLALVKPAPENAPGRLFIVAAALHDQSKAFRGDVEGMVRKMTALHPQVVAVRLSNPVLGQSADLPYATRENLSRSVERVATVMRKNDRVVVMLSTHGHVNVLGVHAGGRPYAHLTGQQLTQMLKPLEAFEHGVVLSACFSGSLIAPLRHDSRWILTAAAADRSSFGCQFSGTLTYYMKALLDQDLKASTPFVQWHELAKRDVSERELREKLSPPSNPQFSLSRKHAQSVTLGELLGL